MYTCLTYVRAILTVTRVHTAARNPAFGPSPSSLCLTTREKGGGGRDGRAGTKGDGVRFCARVQRLRAGREGGTSITRYIGREENEEEVEVGIVQGGVRARVVERQIVRHLTHLIPYLTPSTVTTLIHPFLRRAFLQPDPLTLRAISPPPWSPSPCGPPPPFAVVLYLFTSRHPSPSALSLDGPRRLASFRLPTPYKRSCCPFITTTPTTPTTTTTEGPPAPTSSAILRFLSSFVLSLAAPFNPPRSLAFRPSVLRHVPPVTFPSFSLASAAPRSLLTL